MNYAISLKTAGIVVALLLIAGHALALAQGQTVRDWLGTLPRSKPAALALLAVDFLWTFYIALTMDWGEFYYLRTAMLCLLPVFAYLTWTYVDEFLFVRALGILGLLAAAPLLDAAFLKPQESRLLLVVLAYVWIVAGIFWIAQPHLLRDQIDWVRRSAVRWQAAVYGGLAYGAALLFCALVWY